MVRQEVVDKIRELLQDPSRIRNISVIAHVDHGKSTLTDSLVSAGGLLVHSKAGRELVTMVNPDEKERGITIKSTGITLPFTRTKRRPNPAFNPDFPNERSEEAALAAAAAAAAEPEEETFLVNVIDSPGHFDFSSEVSAALRLTDGALVVVDCVEGVRVQTKTVLRQAVAERVRPVLFLNKLDRVFLELGAGCDLEETYQKFARAVESVNVVISTATRADDPLGNVTVYPEAGTVAFGSGLMGWGFTLKDFAEMYRVKFNMPVKKLMKKLWGEHFWDPKTCKFVTEACVDGRRLQRGFCAFVLEPLRHLFDVVLNKSHAELRATAEKIGVWAKLSADVTAPDCARRTVLEHVMRAWLPSGACLRDLVVDFLPSPPEAQKYRVGNLYQGPQDDEAAEAIRRCDPNGPLMIYVAKMVPTSDHTRFHAFGRIFSGTVRAGQEVRIQGPDYLPGVEVAGKPRDLVVKKLTGVALMMAGEPVAVASAVCGGLVGLVGVDQHLLKNGTVVEASLTTAHNFVCMKYSVAPVVRVAVEAENPSQLAKLNAGLAKLAKSDPLLLVYTDESTGQRIIAGSGELHLEVCLSELEKQFMHGVPIKRSDPVVSYRETITRASDLECIGKSPNKLNRIHVRAQPLSDALCAAIEDGKMDARGDEELRARAVRLVKEFGWDPSDAKKILAFGAPTSGADVAGRANVLVDCSKGVPYMHEIRDALVAAFEECCRAGVLAGEALRGVRFDIVDAKIHSDSPHRGTGQIMPAARAAFFACQLASGPALVEPLYQCDITVPPDHMAGAFQTLRARRAVVLGLDEGAEGSAAAEAAALSSMRTVKAFLPVNESFRFTQVLHKNTSGQAFPSLSFSHWASLPGDITAAANSLALTVLQQVRARKKLKPQLPSVNDYHSKI